METAFDLAAAQAASVCNQFERYAKLKPSERYECLQSHFIAMIVRLQEMRPPIPEPSNN